MLFHQVSVLVLGVVLEVGVELIASGRADHVEKPGQLVIDECQRLGNDGEFYPALAYPLLGDQLFEDQQVPLLIVLLGAALGDPLDDPAGEVGTVGGVGDSDVGDLFPGLVRDAGNQFEDLELRVRTEFAVDNVEELEEKPGAEPVAPPGRLERLTMGADELVMVALGHGSLGLGADRPAEVTRGSGWPVIFLLDLLACAPFARVILAGPGRRRAGAPAGGRAARRVGAVLHCRGRRGPARLPRPSAGVTTAPKGS